MQTQQTPSRAAPHFVLAVLTALSIGAILLSLATAPPNAEQQLRGAAGETVAASSFVISDAITVTQLGAKGPVQTTRVARVVYQAPDRVEESATVNGRSITVLAIGDNRYERSGSGPWMVLGPGLGGVPAGRAAALSVLQPFESITSATDVTRRGDRFSFVPGQRQALLSELLGPQAAQLPPGSTSFTALSSGQYLREFDMTASAQGGRFDIRLDLGSFGQAPALVPPVAGG